MAFTALHFVLTSCGDLPATPEDGARQALIRGEIVPSPSPGTMHQFTRASRFVRMRQYADGRQPGAVLFAPPDVRFSNFSVARPEIPFMDRDTMQRPGEGSPGGVPEIVVDVRSLSNRIQDLVREAGHYTNCGVPDYPVIDPEAETRDG